MLHIKKYILFFHILCCSTISLKKSPLTSNIYEVSSSSFGMHLCSLNLKEVCSADIDALLRLVRNEIENCPDKNQVSSPLMISCWHAAHFFRAVFLYVKPTKRTRNNFHKNIDTIWFNQMFVLYFVYQVLISKN